MTNDTRPNPAPNASDELGDRLRAAREAAGLGLQDVATRLKMPLHVVQALESGRWRELDAPVFVRGQLRSYARLLKVDLDPLLQEAKVEPVKPAELVSYSHVPAYQRLLESVARRAVYVVLTAMIVIPAWLATRSHLGGPAAGPDTVALDVVPEATDAPARAPAAPAHPRVGKRGDPYVASLTPLPRPPAPPVLSFRLNGDSWVQVQAPDGRALEEGLLKAGEQRSYREGEVGRVVLGNAAAVEVQQGGNTVDVTPYQRANVARFAVSSDGSLAPIAD